MIFIFGLLVLMIVLFFALRSNRDEFPGITRWRRGMQGLKGKK